MSAWGAHGAGAAAYGAVRTEVADIDNGLMTIRRVQDVEAVLDDVSRRRNLGATHSKGPDNHWHVAEYPAVLVERYCNDAGITLKEWMRNPVHVERMLRDPALSAFRIHEGRI